MAKRKKDKPAQVEPDDESLPYINGTGVCWGDMHGKVKTRQIGFVRAKVKQVNNGNTRKNTR